MKIHPVGAKLFHADGQMDEQTDMLKLTVTLCNFLNAPELKVMLNEYNYKH